MSVGKVIGKVLFWVLSFALGTFVYFWLQQFDLPSGNGRYHNGIEVACALIVALAIAKLLAIILRKYRLLPLRLVRKKDNN